MRKAINSRQKGKGGELEACRYLRSLGFTDAERTQQHSGNAGDSDVRCPESLPNVFIEVKRSEAFTLGSKALGDAITKAVLQCGGLEPVILWRRNREPWKITFLAVEPSEWVTVAGDDGIAGALRWANGRWG